MYLISRSSWISTSSLRKSSPIRSSLWKWSSSKGLKLVVNYTYVLTSFLNISKIFVWGIPTNFWFVGVDLRMESVDSSRDWDYSCEWVTRSCSIPNFEDFLIIHNRRFVFDGLWWNWFVLWFDYNLLQLYWRLRIPWWSIDEFGLREFENDGELLSASCLSNRVNW